MPTYGYRCKSCGYAFEKFHKITVVARPRCPRCGGKSERLISGGAGLVFKGSGFYITDYKRAGSAHKGKEEGGDSKAGRGKSSRSSKDSGAES